MVQSVIYQSSWKSNLWFQGTRFLRLFKTYGCESHYENTLMQYTAISDGCKNVNFQMIFFIFFLIFAQNIDCRYTLEPPQ